MATCNCNGNCWRYGRCGAVPYVDGSPNGAPVGNWLIGTGFVTNYNISSFCYTSSYENIISKEEAKILLDKFKQLDYEYEDWSLTGPYLDNYGVECFSVGTPCENGEHYEGAVAEVWNTNVDAEAVGELLIAAKKYFILLLKKIAEG